MSMTVFFRPFGPQFGLKIRGSPPMDPPRRYFVTAVITNTVHLAISSDVVIHFIYPILQSTSTLGIVLEMAYGPDRLDHER